MKFHVSSQKPEILHFDGFLLSKSYKAPAKKVQKSYLLWHWGVIPFLNKYDMRNLASFHPTTQKSEHFFLMGSFCSKYTKPELQTYREVIFHDTEQWRKIWVSPDLVVSKISWGIGGTFIRALKSLKNCTLMAFFCPKHIMFQLKNFIGIMRDET